jgi:hypothetical protein
MAGDGAQREGRAAEGHGLAAQLRRDGMQQLQKRIQRCVRVSAGAAMRELRDGDSVCAAYVRDGLEVVDFEGLKCPGS